ncbi:type ISP restriction/modification enzyme [Candidatus Poriferisodalis sp.]|uniref:type ISP restriction/modification enzyme n=1 Tax=Candidatus Poriferisodalis sp. TaxID=3101277 RepID=UPI003B59D61B
MHYAEVPEYADRLAKFTWLTALAPGASSFWTRFESVPANERHDWVNLTDGSFETLPIALCSSGKEAQGDVAVQQHAAGAKTNCDTYVYSFSREELAARVKHLIATYDRARREMHERGVSLSDATANDEIESIKWHTTLKQSAKNNELIEFEDARIRPVLYRPFQQLWMYEDHRILARAKTVCAMFPRDRAYPPPPQHVGLNANQPSHLQLPRNDAPARSLFRRHEPADSSPPAPHTILITGTSNMPFQALAATLLPDLAMIKGSQQTRVLPRRTQAS